MQQGLGQPEVCRAPFTCRDCCQLSQGPVFSLLSVPGPFDRRRRPGVLVESSSASCESSSCWEASGPGSAEDATEPGGRFLDGMAGFRGVLEYSLQVELQRGKHPRRGISLTAPAYTRVLSYSVLSLGNCESWDVLASLQLPFSLFLSWSSEGRKQSLVNCCEDLRTKP